jgi:HEAT repeat protein
VEDLFMTHSTTFSYTFSRIMRILSVLLFLFLTVADEASTQEVIQLLEKLSSPKKEERLVAAQELLKHHYDLVQEKALPVYKSEIDEEVKEALGMILGGFGNPVVLDPMIKLAAQSDDTSKKIHAIKALGKIGDKKASPVLLTALSDPDPKIKRQALIALTRLQEEEAIPQILKLMSLFPEDVKKSINRFGAAARNALIDGLVSDSGEVRKLAVDILGAMKDPSTIPAMMEASEKNQYVIPVLRGFGTEAIPYLFASLRSDTLSTREFAAFLLGELQDPKAIPRLIEALPNTPENAPQALLKFGDKTTTALIEGLNNKTTLKVCANLLGELGSLQAIDSLIEATASGEEDPVEALVQIGRPAVGALNKHLRSTNDVQRRAVARAIGRIGDSRSISALLSVLKDPNSSIKKDAIYALGFIKYRPATPFIMKELESDDPGVREESRNSLIQYGKEYLVQKLQKRYPFFVKQLNNHIMLIESHGASAPSAKPSDNLDYDEEQSPREQIIRSRIRLFESLTFTKDAIKTFEELRKETVLDEKDHYHLARLYRQIGKKRRMKEELQISLTINPNFDKALNAIKKLGYEYKHGRLRAITK